MRLLICGSRDWTDYNKIYFHVADLTHQTNIEVVIDGQANGADSLGHLVAKRLNLNTLRFPANWKQYGRAAGVIRNQQMLDEGKPTFVLAFHHDLKASRGTKDMVNRCKKYGIAYKVIN